MSDPVWEKIQRETAAFEEAVKDTGLYHRGYTFYAPFACGRCGDPVSARQFAFGRACGACDGGHTLERFSIYDPRWFLSGPAVLTNPDDRWLIHPEFIPAATREQYPRRQQPRPRMPPKPPKPERRRRI